MKLTGLQKELLVWIVFFLVCSGTGMYYIQHTPNEHPGIIRLHVIANSDSKEDQQLKLKVRDQVLQIMKGQESIEASRKYIDANIESIEARADAVIEKEGFDYRAKAKRKVTFIPEKSYEDLTLPGGNYETLNITLGKGKGHNWWCVIFPQLCLIGDESPDGKIVLKSKIKEMMKEEQKRQTAEEASAF